MLTKKGMKRINIILIASTLLIFTGCTTQKKLAYFNTVTASSAESINAQLKNERADARILTDDRLSITVSALDPNAVAIYNLPFVSFASPGSDQIYASPVLQSYLVNSQGNINFPVLGEIHVGGLTKLEIENLIIDKLKVYLKEAPLVTVRIVNYRISVLGEVTKPGSFVVSNEKINLLEALAMAGDLTIYGMRDNVKLIRTGQDNKQEIITMDLNKAETVLSPYYQLQQNDIIYVTPNKTKAKNSDIGTNTGLWFSATSILVSLANILVILLNK
jgi:polysaccharide export outer membrane protein